MSKLTNDELVGINELSTKSVLIKRLLEAYSELAEFDNPKPVVVGLVPAKVDGRIGVVTIRRAIVPGLGQLALPGGYLEVEDWRDGLAREVREEIGVDLNPSKFHALNVVSGRQNQVLLVFAVYEDAIFEKSFEGFIPNREVSEVKIVFQPEELAFPAHTAALQEFFGLREI